MNTASLAAFFTRIIQYRFTAHLAFWVGLISIVLYTSISESDKSALEFQKTHPYFAAEMLVFLIVMAIPVYSNLYVLMPRLFYPRKLVLYFVLLIGMVGAMTLIDYWVLGKFIPIFTKTNWGQQLINHTFFIILTMPAKLYRDSMRKQLNLRELQAKQYKAELDLLRAQINPHFLFNTLNNLYALTLEKSDDAPDVVLRLSTMMRYLLESSRADTVPLAQEVSFLNNYFSLEKIRLKTTTDIHFETQGDYETLPIAPMLLIPFAENAFKHGANRAIEGGFVHAVLRCEPNELLFYVENNLPDSQIPASVSTGMGLANVRRRLELLYPNAAELEIQQENTTFRVQLRICPFPA